MYEPITRVLYQTARAFSSPAARELSVEYNDESLLHFQGTYVSMKTMSLTPDDIQAIRNVVEETVNPIKGGLQALGNDIKEIYGMIDELQKV